MREAITLHLELYVQYQVPCELFSDTVAVKEKPGFSLHLDSLDTERTAQASQHKQADNRELLYREMYV